MPLMVQAERGRKRGGERGDTKQRLRLDSNPGCCGEDTASVELNWVHFGYMVCLINTMKP